MDPQEAIEIARRQLGARVLDARVSSDRYLSVAVATGHRWGKVSLSALVDLADALGAQLDQVEVWDILGPAGEHDRIEVSVDLLEVTPVESPAARRRR